MSLLQSLRGTPIEAGRFAPIRLMLVDDSLVARTVMSRLLDRHAEFEIVAQAHSADRAIDLLGEHLVDIILLDLEMPGRHGLLALPDILACGKGARVLIVSSAAGDGATATMRALSLGAADTLLKPAAGSLTTRFADMLIGRLRRIGHAQREGYSDTTGGMKMPERPIHGGRIECLAIGASTGGVSALAELLVLLPDSFAAPILVTQHLPPVFMPYFAAQLQELSGRPAQVARDGMTLPKGGILVAPGEGHLRLRRCGDAVRVWIDADPAPSGCMPSVDPMLASLASTFGGAGLGVVLSGMGRDGLAGAGHVVDVGGEVLVQDEASSVIWGMPGCVAVAGLASAVLSPRAIAARITLRAGATSWT